MAAFEPLSGGFRFFLDQTEDKPMLHRLAWPLVSAGRLRKGADGPGEGPWNLRGPKNMSGQVGMVCECGWASANGNETRHVCGPSFAALAGTSAIRLNLQAGLFLQGGMVQREASGGWGAMGLLGAEAARFTYEQLGEGQVPSPWTQATLPKSRSHKHKTVVESGVVLLHFILEDRAADH